MEPVIYIPSLLEIIVASAAGLVFLIAGGRSKWKYISRDKVERNNNPQENFNRAETPARVRRLAILFVICLFGMAFSLIIFAFNRIVLYSVSALIFAGACAFAHFLIDLDTSI